MKSDIKSTIRPLIVAILFGVAPRAFGEREVGGVSEIVAVRLEFTAESTNGECREDATGSAPTTCRQGDARCEIITNRCKDLRFCLVGTEPHQGATCPEGFGTCDRVAGQCNDQMAIDAETHADVLQLLGAELAAGRLVGYQIRYWTLSTVSNAQNACALVPSREMFDELYPKMQRIVDAGNARRGHVMTRYLSDVACDDIALRRFPDDE